MVGAEDHIVPWFMPQINNIRMLRPRILDFLDYPATALHVRTARITGGHTGRLGVLPEKGVVGVIEKPFGPDRIVQVIERFPVELLPTPPAPVTPKP